MKIVAFLRRRASFEGGGNVAELFSKDVAEKFFGGDAGFLGGFENKLVEFVRHGNTDGFFFGVLFERRGHNLFTQLILANLFTQSSIECVFEPPFRLFAGN